MVIGLVAAPLAGTASADVTVPGNYPSIQAAINAVLNGSLPNGTTINVQPGTYFEALSIVDTNRSVTVRGVGNSGATIIDAAGRNTAALTVWRATGQVVLRGLTFRHGSRPSVEGGGFLIREASPALTDCVFEANTAYNGGGGSMYASNATFTDCVVRNNIASHFAGGIFILAGSRPIFTNCDIVGNSSGVGGAGVGNIGAGGGVFSHDSSPTFRGVRVRNNASKFAAGGIFHQGIFGSAAGVATLVIEDSEVSDNVSSQFSAADNPAEGGGMHVEDNATAQLTRVRVLRNRANTGAGLNAYRARYDVVDSVIAENVAAAASQANTGFGGGIAATSNNPPGAPSGPGSIVNLTRTLVRQNTAVVAGAGIAIFGDNFSAVRARLSLTTSVISGNQSQSQGGGVMINRTDGVFNDSLVISNAVAGGSAPFGGGLVVTAGSTASISGTTFARNSASQYGGGIFVDAGSNLQMNVSRIYDNSAAAFSGGGLFVGPAGTAGTVQNSIIADNGGHQIVEHLCPSTSLHFVNNTVTPRSGNNDIYLGICNSTATTASTITQFNATPSGRASGNNSNLPRFVHFIAAPGTGTSFTLAWSAARATGVTISSSGGVLNRGGTGTEDTAPGGSTTYTLVASASQANGGNYGAVAVGVTVVGPPSSIQPDAVDGDFNGDGSADITVFRPSDGVWYFRYSNGAVAGIQWGGGADVPAPADYNGDGRADIAVFRPSDGVWYLRYSTGQTAGIQWGTSGDIPVPGDYDGDGRADIAVFRPSDGVWYFRYATGQTAGIQWGGGGDKVAPADYNGDGLTDIAVFRPSVGVWFIRYSGSGTTAGFQWGGGGDIPVPGDYNGDGVADIAVFRPSDGVWYLRYSGSTPPAGFQWGGGADVPVPGDYNGDGLTDIAVFRPADGTWYLRFSGSGLTSGIQWGIGTDIPILKR
jgi:hypothetical protein